MSYNGWKNWATWIVINWYNDSFADLALDAVLNGETDPNDLADRLCDEFYDAEVFPTPDTIRDLVTPELENIDWFEIAETLYADAVNNVED
ncbi:MAG: hypothetical protein RBS17_07530 [Coriobacteriia bacterium]|nr:hypothetical protein [Coriobacteriia bacterium]